jgi:hypothetical protein
LLHYGHNDILFYYRGAAPQSRAQALADALRAEGIASGPGYASGEVDRKPNVILIEIGPKTQ